MQDSVCVQHLHKCSSKDEGEGKVRAREREEEEEEERGKRDPDHMLCSWSNP